MAFSYTLLMRGLGMTAALVFAFMGLLVCADVATRNLGVQVMPWAVEMSEYCLPLATFLAAPWVLHENGHVRVDVLLRTCPERLARTIELLADLVGLAISLAILVYGTLVLFDTAGSGSLVIKVLVFPAWWLNVPLVVCFLLTTVEFARRILVSVNGG